MCICNAFNCIILEDCFALLPFLRNVERYAPSLSLFCRDASFPALLGFASPPPLAAAADDDDDDDDDDDGSSVGCLPPTHDCEIGSLSQTLHL
jgi:hypothetical protein